MLLTPFRVVGKTDGLARLAELKARSLTSHGPPESATPASTIQPMIYTVPQITATPTYLGNQSAPRAQLRVRLATDNWLLYALPICTPYSIPDVLLPLYLGRCGKNEVLGEDLPIQVGTFALGISCTISLFPLSYPWLK